MDAVKQAAGNGEAKEQAPTRTARLVQEIAQLLQASLSPGEFYADYLQRVLSVLKGVAGAVWTVAGPGTFHLQYQINTNEVGLDRITNGRSCHAELLRVAVGRDSPLWVPPHSGPDVSDGKIAGANLSDYGLLLAPIVVDGEVVGLVEVWQDFYQDSQVWRGSSRLLGELAGFAAAFLHKNRLRHLQEQQRLWSQLQAFVRQVHGSLDPREVAYAVANNVRPIAGCDQVVVALRRATAVRIEAVSGAGEPDWRSPLVRAMRHLCRAVLEWGEPLVFVGARDESLPPAVLGRLDEYLAQSQGRLLVALPLRDERDADARACRALLLAESFDADFDREAVQRALALVTPHAAAALHNAVEHDRLPFRGTARWILRRRDSLRRGWTKVGLTLVVVLAIVGALAVVPAPLRVDAAGQLLPCERQVVFAPFAGKVVEMKVRHGDRVARNQELLFMEDLETQLKVEQLALKGAAAEHRLAVLGDQIAKAATDDDRDALVKERIEQEYELRKAVAERAILLQGAGDPRWTAIAAPLAGKVVTFDAREQLVGKTVKPGDPLLRVAASGGHWEIELLIPEGNLGPIHEALSGKSGSPLDVDLLLASQPHRTYKGQLFPEGLGGETVVKNNGVVLPARVRITDPDLLGQLPTMPVGVEVRAKVHCGYRPVGSVWFFDLWEFFYEHVLF